MLEEPYYPTRREEDPDAYDIARDMWDEEHEEADCE